LARQLRFGADFACFCVACTIRRVVALKLGVTLAAFSFVVIACGSDGTTSSVDPETACNDAVSAICDKVQQCAAFAFNAAFTDTDPAAWPGREG
jgi:hypothetical protein